MVAEGGVEAKELPHPLAMGAPTRNSLLAGGEMANEELETPAACGETGAGAPPLVRLHVVWAHVSAPFCAYVLETLHRLVQLQIKPLIFSVSNPSLPTLLLQLDKKI